MLSNLLQNFLNLLEVNAMLLYPVKKILNIKHNGCKLQLHSPTAMGIVDKPSVNFSL
jgi:hypothetical protein